MQSLWKNSEGLYPVTRQLLADSGVVPMRKEKKDVLVLGPLRNVFRTDFATEQFKKMVESLKAHPFVNVIYLGDLDAPVTRQAPMIYADETNLIDPVVTWASSKRIDGILVIPPNYGCENIAAMTASQLFENFNKRIPVATYFWPDKKFEIDGKRYSDNGCGIFPLRNWMARMMGVIPDYFPFCEVDSAELMEAWDDFIRLCSGIYCINNFRVMRVGGPVPTFPAIRYSEPALMKKNMRLEDKETIDLVTFVKEVLGGSVKKPSWYCDLKKELESIFDFSEVEAEFPDLAGQLALTLGWLIEKMGETHCNSVTIRCWPEIQEQIAMMVCQLNGLLYSLGIMAPCETDLLGGTASALLHGFGIGDELDLNTFLDFTTPFGLGDSVEEGMSVLWWHCGQCPHRGMRGYCAGCKMLLRKGWILPSRAAGLGHSLWGEVGDIVTFAQIRPDEKEQLRVIGMRSDITEGDETIGTHFYTEFPPGFYQWAMESIPEHHWSVRIGDYYELLQASVKWLDLPGDSIFFDGC